MNLHIFLRQTSHNKINHSRPEWFSYEKCFKNLLDTLDECCKLKVIFDGNLNDHFTNKYKKQYKFDIIQITAGSDLESNIQTFKIIRNNKNIKKDDYIYVLENDYLHVNDWVEIFLDLSEWIKGWHYLSLFDHNDKYLFVLKEHKNIYGAYKNLKSKIYVTNYRHWRTIPNCCGSFIVSKKVFDEDFETHITGGSDSGRFNILTKTKKRIILSPIPALSTHLELPFISPIIKWKEEINDNVKLLN